MASVASSCKMSNSSSSSPSVTTNARDSGASSCSNNMSERVSEDDTLLTPYSPVPVVRSHHQLAHSPYSGQSRRHRYNHSSSYGYSYSHNRHYHLNGDSFDDSSSSLSSTPSSGCTTATATSSTSSTVSDCAIDCIHDSLTMQLANSSSSRHSKNDSHASHSSRSGHKASSNRNVISEQELNDLNCSPSSSHHSRSSRKSASSKTQSGEREGRGGVVASGRSSTPPALSNTENWSHFHFGGGAEALSSRECNDSHRNLSPRASSEVCSLTSTLDQRLKSVTLASSPKSSSGKAVAVIKGTASVSRLSSNSFNNGSLSTQSNSTCSQDWKKHLHSHEIRKLKRELDQSNEKVATLTSQLATHSHMVTAFEQSLASMSLRLQQLTNLSSQKDCEIARLKSKVDELRSANRNDSATSLGPATPKKSRDKKESKSKNVSITSSATSACATTSKQVSEKERKSLLVRRHTFVSPVVSDLEQREVTHSSKEGKWFKAFRRSNSKKNSSIGGASDYESEDASRVMSHGCRVASVESFSQLDSNNDSDAILMHELKKQLREKEKTITDLRLEALTTAHQLQSLEELLSQLRGEIANYKSENERLSKLSTGSAASSMASIRLSAQSSPSKANEPSVPLSDEWKNCNEASGYATINTLYFNPYNSC